MLFIGDSHAHNLIPPLDWLGKKYNLRVDVWVHYGCPPLWGTYKVFGDNNRIRRERSCKRTVPKWEKEIASGKYDYVALASRWTILYESTNYGEMNVRRDFLVDRENPALDIKSSRELFVSSLNKTVEKILSSGARAIIFSQYPEIGKEIQDCNMVPPYLYSDKHIEARCANNVSYENIMKRHGFTDTTIRNLASENVLSIIPSDYFCDHVKKTCSTIMDNILLYKDTNHLSRNGSLLLGMMIEEKFAEFLSND